MKYGYAYHHLDKNEYFALTQFDKSDTKLWRWSEIEAAEGSRGSATIYKFEISQSLFSKILEFLEREGIRTRDPAPEAFRDGVVPYSFSVYTVNFGLHAVQGKRGGWFIVTGDGREPFIKEEFIAYGAMRKSGTRRGRYRRNLSQTEKSQVEWLESRTPSLKKLYEWVSKKYPTDVKRVSLHFEKDELPF